MRRGYPSDEELREAFEEQLARVLRGSGVVSCTGLDMETDDALLAVMMAYPAVTPELVEAARQAFAGQLDGSNAARWEADFERWLDGREQRRQPGAEAE